MKSRLSVPVLAAIALAALTVASAEPASACAVCFGGESSDMTTGMNNGIVTLLAVVGVVQVGFVSLFGSIWYRTRKLRKHRERFQIIEGER